MPPNSSDNSSDSGDGSHRDPRDGDDVRSDDGSFDVPSPGRIDRETVIYLTISIFASILFHLGVFGAIGLIGQFDWSIRADISWEVDDTKLRQVGLGPADGHDAAPPPPPTKSESQGSEEKESTEQDDKNAGDEVSAPDNETMDKALAGELELDDTATEETTTDDDANETSDSGAEATPTTPDEETPTADESNATSESADDAEGGETDFTAKQLGRAGPADLPRLENFAPGNAKYTTLLRLDRLRGTLYEDAVANLFQSLPDYRLLAESTDLDPIERLDSIFFASARPQFIQHTFLAVRHRMTQDEVQRAVDARYPDPPAWSTQRGLPTRPLVPDGHRFRDPRHIVLADTGLTLIARPEWMERIATALEQSDRRTDESTRKNNDLADRSGSLIGGLRRIESVADQNETIALVSAYGLNLRLPGVGAIDGFRGVRLEIANPDNPTVTIDMHFHSQDAAASFTGRFGRIRQSLLDAIPLGSYLGIDTYIDRLTAQRHEDFVQIRASYTPEEARRLAELLYNVIPRPPSLESLPTTEPTTNSNPPDAGSPTPDTDSSPRN